MGLILWGLPIIAVLMFIVFNNEKVFYSISIGVSVALAVISGILTKNVIILKKVEYAAFGGVFYIDSVSMIILDVVIIIGLMVNLYSIGYLKEELRHGEINFKRAKLYYILMYSFIFTIILSLTVKSIGIMWIAIEATTLASAFLVGFNNDKKALEAAWKYIIICSVGIAVALLGIIFLHLSSVGVFNGNNLLEWPALFDNAKSLKGPVLRLAFIFILIGFGTKAGLAPMHTWLPDAHSQAPSPISALLSGVLLNSAMYAIIRTVSIVNKNFGNSNFTGRLLIAAGIISIGTAAIFILTQKDYKRFLAYSSIEHMGIIALGIGVFTPTSVFGAFFHMINHSFTKSMLFLSSGNILQKYGTRQISKVRSLVRILPISGTAFFLGLFAISGTPPFSIFASELNVIASVFEKKQFFLGMFFAILLAVVFVGIALTLFKIFYKSDDTEDLSPGETNKLGAVMIMILLVVVSITGVYMPQGLKTLITDAQKIVLGG